MKSTYISVFRHISLHKALLKCPLTVSKASVLRLIKSIVGGGGGTPYQGLYGEALPKRGIFFRLQVYKRVGILLVGVNERAGKCLIWVCERAQRTIKHEFYGFIKSRKRSIFVIDSYWNDSAFTAVKSTGKNNRFQFLDILGYLKNTHKDPKFGRVRQVPIWGLSWEFPGWDLSHFAKFGISMGIL